MAAVQVYRVTHPQGLWYHTTKTDENGPVYKEAHEGALLDADAHPDAVKGLLKGKYIEKVEAP